MVTFETIKSEEITFGSNDFIEVARKKAVTDEGENEFIALARGFMQEDGTRRYKKNFSIPDNADVVNFIAQHLPSMVESE